jgi:peptidoglycan/xylan/chitin deacetylase (PgdA/CDA1 family)
VGFRIAVFTAALSHHVIRTVDRIAAEHPDAELLVMLHRPRRRARRLIRNQFRNLKRHGWRWIPYQAAEIARSLRRAKAGAGWKRPPRVDLRAFPSLNGPQAVGALRSFAPDLGVSLAAPILKPALFAQPRLGTINIHKGKLPDYRGMPPAFWELWNGEAEVGITVHKVEAGLDSGPILLEDRVPVERFSTPAGLRVRLDELGVGMVAEAVRQLREGRAAFVPQPPGGCTRTRPTLAQEAALRRRLGPAGGAGRHIKRAVFNAYGALRPADPDSVLVLLYHRVSDAFRDSVTIGVEQFDTQMRWLADHVRLVGLDAIIRGELPSDGPVVAISFDDGYRDNYENAAPILLKHRVPATFFISTDKVERNEPFDHDLAKLGFGLANMSWREVREMHSEGLAFGSHTANHINLAATDADRVAAELARSRDAIRLQLGQEEILFAYPFGKRRDITPERLEQVKQAGYAGNCSAYGGVNSRRADRWDIRRQGVDHSFDIPAIRAKLAGWKAERYA